MRSRLLRLKLWMSCATEMIHVAPVPELPRAWRSFGGPSVSFCSGTTHHAMDQRDQP
jgi:hypothetical protein